MSVPVVRFTVAATEGASYGGSGRPYTLVYDGDCRVCTRLSRVLDRLDTRRQIELVTSQTAGVTARFPWIPLSAYRAAIQLIGPGGRTWQGAAAVEEVIRVLPRWRWVAWIFHVPFVRDIADRIYRWVARNRYRLGCGQHCVSRPLDVSWPD